MVTGHIQIQVKGEFQFFFFPGTYALLLVFLLCIPTLLLVCHWMLEVLDQELHQVRCVRAADGLK